jgi:glucose-6-phosphate-specific signal transduction histidine kinase
MAHTNKKAALESAAQNIQRINSTSAEVQRDRILAFLRGGKGMSTIDARHLLDCMHPAARVQELRNNGFDIQTQWHRQETPEGRQHRVALYHLVSEAAHAR